MPLSKKRTHQRHSEPKLFQCTGFGDCHMVFTRSEHLARHARKHTGEKPFKCVVHGCERAFSRFDNMIQHTSTHNKKNTKHIQNRKPSNIKPNTKEMNSPQHLVPHITIPLDMDCSSPSSGLSLSASPVSDMGSPYHQRLPSISDSYFQNAHSTATTSASMDYFTHISTPGATSPIHPTFLPSPKELLHHHMPLYPLKSASEYDHSADSNDTWSSPSSPASITSSTLSPPPSPASFGGDLTRRLSTMELELPIHELSDCHGAGANGINVTWDEFEALQAFSQLSSPSSARPFHHQSRPTSVSFNIGATQVNAFRQHLSLAHESNSRLSPRSSI